MLALDSELNECLQTSQHERVQLEMRANAASRGLVDLSSQKEAFDLERARFARMTFARYLRHVFTLH